jgi:hypothetical protein
MTLIHKNYSFPGNIQKISIPNSISSYIQIIEIQNKPLKPIIIINIYLPSHQEDITLIPIIKNEISHITTTYHTHVIILLGDFNKDIKLIGRHTNQVWHPPNIEDKDWNNFIKTEKFTYILTNTKNTRQGGKNYTATSLIDGFYVKNNNTLPVEKIYKSHMLTNQKLNSDHYPVILNIPSNTLISRPPNTIETPTSKLPNTILPNQLQAL